MRRVAIIGAAGRDFHVFNMFFRNNPEYRVIAFLMTQIPIPSRRYPPELAGAAYPEGVPIYTWSDYGELAELVKKLRIDEAVLAYSDLLYDDVGHIMSAVVGAGASFRVLGPNDTYLNSIKPVIAVLATRTGAGKSTISRAIVRELISRNIKVAVVRHPMPYRDLVASAVEIYRTRSDLARITFEEREEYEQYVDMGVPVLAGVDYGRVLAKAEEMGDVILWDGGNNDFPFFRPDFVVVVTDARRPGHEVSSFPGEANVRMADVVVISKVGDSDSEKIRAIEGNIRSLNPRATIVKADFRVSVDRGELLRGKRALVVEDAPTVTHGGLPYGAGYVAAIKYGATVVDPRPYAVGALKEVYSRYPHIGPVLPSLGYTEEQKRDLEETIRRVDSDVVVMGTPAKIEEVVNIPRPVVRVRWSPEIVEGLSIAAIVDIFLRRVKLA
ncbi:cyclic 2,3-diphosphoglycerate synthase [Thermoproteus tenax]|uniref:Predicted GTPase n=1 Tax=Thermoproteus tenax (strain ATCC 35583 / DSM 2078 / JCM 9277 / NBRC 100435 / Kra 1) TaxID=768679 RepID=G4RL12_THETK|nr:cyclic 2,3-diphosphoglycerate synthase [Thermoproteus tenax]CCC82257.1 Predicted GTPase [Thermoproteus tenax Kra 1]